MMPLIRQFLPFTVIVLELLAFNIWIGLALTIAGLPPRMCRYAIPFAAIVGYALLGIVLTPLSILGIPVRTSLPIFLIFISMGNLLVLRKLYLSQSGLRRIRVAFAYFRNHAIEKAGVIAIICFLGASLITQGGKGHIDDAWGSSDWMVYWIVSDYLQEYPANIASYSNQSTFYCSYIVEHIVRWARLGSFLPLSAWSYFFSPGNSYSIINPAITMAMLFYLALASCLLRIERCRARWPILVLSVFPFLHFLLFFSYYGQAVSIPVMLLGFLWIEKISSGKSRTKNNRVGIIAMSCLFASAIISYPTGIMTCGIFFSLLLAYSIFIGRYNYRTVLWTLALSVLLCAYYLPHSFQELSYVSQMTTLPGWNWSVLIGMKEILGIEPLLSYSLTSLPLAKRHTVELLLLLSFSLLIYKGIRRSQLPLFNTAILLSTLILCSSAIYKIISDVPHASHAYVKAISQFVPFLLVTALVPVCAYLEQSKKVIRISFYLLITGWTCICLNTTLKGSNHPAWYSKDLVTLIRSYKADVEKFAFVLGVKWWGSSIIFSPITRDDRKILIPYQDEYLKTSNEPYSVRFVAWPDSKKLLLERLERGNFALGLPPSEVHPTIYDNQPWGIAGWPALRWFGDLSSQYKVVLGKPSGVLKIQYHCSLPTEVNEKTAQKMPLSMRVRVNNSHENSYVLEKTKGQIIMCVPFAAKAYDYAEIQFQLISNASSSSQYTNFRCFIDYIAWEDTPSA